MTGAATSFEGNNDVNSLSLRQALDYCLDVLKIKENSEIYKNIFAEFMSQTKVPLAMIKTHGNWITAMKLIADCSGILNYNNNNNNCHVFSQTQLYDFLALATKVIEGERVNNNNNIILKILRDITENYGNFSDYLKSNYPGIIVDVISIINKGMDAKGIKVSSISIEKYYQSRKQQQQGTMTEEREEQTTVASASTSTTAAAARDKDEILLSLYSKNNIVESLSQITNRERKEIQESLAKLQDSDLKRISDLCRNYSRLQQYTKLITKKEGSQDQFKKEIQKDLGRKLRSHQLGRAANSIIRARTYIENILDNKFIPDASHGINHVKHNLEYGYQLMNLIERTRRRRQRIQ
jgi:hypothetical protein